MRTQAPAGNDEYYNEAAARIWCTEQNAKQWDQFERSALAWITVPSRFECTQQWSSWQTVKKPFYRSGWRRTIDLLWLKDPSDPLTMNNFEGPLRHFCFLFFLQQQFVTTSAFRWRESASRSLVYGLISWRKVGNIPQPLLPAIRPERKNRWYLRSQKWQLVSSPQNLRCVCDTLFLQRKKFEVVKTPWPAKDGYTEIQDRNRCTGRPQKPSKRKMAGKPDIL